MAKLARIMFVDSEGVNNNTFINTYKWGDEEVRIKVTYNSDDVVYENLKFNKCFIEPKWSNEMNNHIGMDDYALDKAICYEGE